MLPIQVNEAIQTNFPIPDLNVEQPDETFISLGYDVVYRPLGTEFGCSPLSCNQLAEKFVVNRYCLLDDASAAFELAFKMESLGSEPGPYFIVEVLRQKTATT